MTQITSLDELWKRNQQLEQGMDIRERNGHPESLVQIKVAMATCGIASGARAVMNAFVEKIKKEKIPAVITQTGCMGYCYAEPTVEVKKPGKEPIVFGHVDAKKAVELVDKYVKDDEMIDGIIPVNYEKIDK